jgi:hypothetical protein
MLHNLQRIAFSKEWIVLQDSQLNVVFTSSTFSDSGGVFGFGGSTNPDILYLYFIKTKYV